MQYIEFNFWSKLKIGAVVANKLLKKYTTYTHNLLYYFLQIIIFKFILNITILLAKKLFIF